MPYVNKKRPYKKEYKQQKERGEHKNRMERQRARRKLDKEKSLKFNIAKDLNRDFTQYYDLIYEYKNDCLIAGVKYNKQYYEDRDLKPSENILFTLTLFPLTTYEQSQNK